MLQPITTSVTMDAESFQKFRSFDLFHHQKRWQRPLLFAAILLGSSGICLSQVGVREGASLLAVVRAPGSVLLHLLPGPAHHHPEAGPPSALLPPPAGRCRPFRLDGRRTGQAPAQPPVPVAGPSRSLPHPGRRVPLRPADPSLPRQRRGAGLSVGLPEDASPRLPAAGPAVTPLFPCKQQAPWNPDGVLPSPVSWDFFCAKTTKTDGAMI